MFREQRLYFAKKQRIARDAYHLSKKKQQEEAEKHQRLKAERAAGYSGFLNDETIHDSSNQREDYDPEDDFW